METKNMIGIASAVASAAAEAERSGKGMCIHHADIYTGYTHISGGFILIEAGEVKNVYSGSRYENYRNQEDFIHVDAGGLTVTPGFIDTHIHGVRGFGVDQGRTEDIIGMSRVLPEYGVTAFIPTIPTLPEEETLRIITSIVSAQKSSSTGARILGMHLEGPFINKEKRGIHEEQYIREVDLALFKRYAEAAEGNLAAMTVAPELRGMRELVLEAQEQGVVLLAGHSNATYDQMLEGIEAGILHATHFFNAMRSMHHRDPGVVGAILIHPELSCELIADGMHVHPALIEFLVKEKTAGKIVIVTDALNPAGLPESGTYTVKGDSVRRKGGVFMRLEDDTIAGSALTMDRGVFNMISYGVDPSDAVNMASLNPARVYDRDHELGSLLPGKQADLFVCDRDITPVATLIGGKLAFARGV